MALHSKQQYAQLARTLPPQLTRFFARYPPAALLPQLSTAPTTSTTTQGDTNTVAADLPSSSTLSSEPQSQQLPINPFQSQKHPVTGRWHDPVYSLRRQADLVKLARKHGVEELLPFTVKGTEERMRRRLEHGLRVKGTGVGERVKGKSDERTLKAKYVHLFEYLHAIVLERVQTWCTGTKREGSSGVLGLDLKWWILQDNYCYDESSC